MSKFFPPLILVLPASPSIVAKMCRFTLVKNFKTSYTLKLYKTANLTDYFHLIPHGPTKC